MAEKKFPLDYNPVTVAKILAAAADNTTGYVTIEALKIALGVDAETLHTVTDRGNATPNSITVGTAGATGRVVLDPSETAVAFFSSDNNVRGRINSNEENNVEYRAFNFAKHIFKGGDMEVSGNISATGSITPGSDKRLKKKIKTISGNLEKIEQLRPVSYNAKYDNAKALGFIADEVQKLFPELVLTGKGKDKMLALNYMGMTAPIVGAIQELSQKHKELQSKYDDLLKRVEALESK